jgi:hypothetical protein
MNTPLENFQIAVREAIADSHKRGIPVFQCEDGYIIALHPDGRKVKLQKAKFSNAYHKQ